MRIGIDVDGPLADFVGAHTKLIEQRTGVKIPLPVTKWDYANDYISKTQNNKIWHEINHSEFWVNVEPTTETPEVLKRLTMLRYEGHHVYFITSRTGVMAKYLTEEWFRRLGYFNPTVLISNDKGPVAEGLNLDLFIDDKPSNCEEVARQAKPECRVCLLDAPYNQAFDPSDLVIDRVPSVMSMLDDMDAYLMKKAA